MILEAVGFQDQILTAIGGLRLLHFNATDTWVESIDIDPRRLAELERSLLLVYSGAMRDSHGMAGKRVAKVEANRRALEALTADALEGAALLRGVDRLEAIGELLHATWQRKRSLHPEISSPVIDAIYARARELGAIGGKLLGAGGGGFL